MGEETRTIHQGCGGWRGMIPLCREGRGWGRGGTPTIQSLRDGMEKRKIPQRDEVWGGGGGGTLITIPRGCEWAGNDADHPGWREEREGGRGSKGGGERGEREREEGGGRERGEGKEGERGGEGGRERERCTTTQGEGWGGVRWKKTCTITQS